jgi:hypothetical protein
MSYTDFGFVDLDPTNGALQSAHLEAFGAWVAAYAANLNQRHMETLTSAFTMCSPLGIAIPTASWTVENGTSVAGEFVPFGTTAFMRLCFTGGFLFGFPTSGIGIAVYYADITTYPGLATGALYPLQGYGESGDVTPTGVTTVNFGLIQDVRPNLAGEAALTGLTAGHTYRFQVTAAVMGFAEQLSSISSDAHTACAVAGAVGPMPDLGFMMMTRTSGAEVCSFVLNHAQQGAATDRYLGRIALPSGASTKGRIAITPNGSFFVCTNTLIGSTNQITAGGTGQSAVGGIPAGAPTISYSVSLGTSDEPYPIAIAPNGSFAYIGIISGTNVGKVVQLDIFDEVLSYSSVLATSCVPVDICINPAGTFAYVADQFNKKIIKCTMPATPSDTTFVTASSSSAALGVAPQCLAISPDGTTLAIGAGAAGTGELYLMNTSTMTVTATTALASTTVPGRIQWHADQQAIMLVSTGSSDPTPVWQYNPNGALYTSWALASGLVPAGDMVLSPYGDIIATDPSGFLVDCWQGCLLDVNTTSGDFINVFRWSVTVEGAT